MTRLHIPVRSTGITPCTGTCSIASLFLRSYTQPRTEYRFGDIYPLPSTLPSDNNAFPYRDITCHSVVTLHGDTLEKRDGVPAAPHHCHMGATFTSPRQGFTWHYRVRATTVLRNYGQTTTTNCFTSTGPAGSNYKPGFRSTTPPRRRKARKKPVARVRHSSTPRIEEIMIYEKMHAVRKCLTAAMEKKKKFNHL